MRIAFGELRIGEIARQRIQACLEKNWVSEGENVQDFERLFAAHFGCHWYLTHDNNGCAAEALHEYFAHA